MSGATLGFELKCTLEHCFGEGSWRLSFVGVMMHALQRPVAAYGGLWRPMAACGTAVTFPSPSDPLLSKAYSKLEGGGL
jgi:hypothetical protein